MFLILCPVKKFVDETCEKKFIVCIFLVPAFFPVQASIQAVKPLCRSQTLSTASAVFEQPVICAQWRALGSSSSSSCYIVVRGADMQPCFCEKGN